MRPDLIQRLNDAIESINTIEGFLDGVGLDVYVASE